MNSAHLCCNFIAFVFVRKFLYFSGILVERINNSTESLAYCLISNLSMQGTEVQNEKKVTFLLIIVQTDPRTHPTTYLVSTWRSFFRDKATGVWSWPLICMLCWGWETMELHICSPTVIYLNGMDRDLFAFLLINCHTSTCVAYLLYGWFSYIMDCEMESQNSLKIHVVLDVLLFELLNSEYYFERLQCLHCQEKRVMILQNVSDY